MTIIGCDLHSRYQVVAWVDEETGEIRKRRLEHEQGSAELGAERTTLRPFALIAPAFAIGVVNVRRDIIIFMSVHTIKIRRVSHTETLRYQLKPL